MAQVALIHSIVRHKSLVFGILVAFEIQRGLYARLQKLRASRSKDEAEQMRCQLLDRDAVIADLRAEVDTVRAQSSKLSREKNQTEAEISALQMSVHRLVLSSSSSSSFSSTPSSSSSLSSFYYAPAP